MDIPHPHPLPLPAPAVPCRRTSDEERAAAARALREALESALRDDGGSGSVAARDAAGRTTAAGRRAAVVGGGGSMSASIQYASAAGSGGRGGSGMGHISTISPRALPVLENVGTQLQTLYSSLNQAERFAGIAALDELLDLDGEDYRSRVQRTYNGLRVILTKVRCLFCFLYTVSRGRTMFVGEGCSNGGWGEGTVATLPPVQSTYCLTCR